RRAEVEDDHEDRAAHLGVGHSLRCHHRHRPRHRRDRTDHGHRRIREDTQLEPVLRLDVDAADLYLRLQLRPVSPGAAAMASSERAWAAALVLVLLVMVLNLLARLIAKALAPKSGR